jgi:hypothetical protein
MFMAVLNNLEFWATDIGNSYLEVLTAEKFPKVGDLEVHALVISKALYGLRSSGARWHDRFADCTSELRFFPCKMHKSENTFEYIAVSFDDLAIAMKMPKKFDYILEQTQKLKTIGTGPVTFHLGMDFFRDGDNTLCISSIKYIEKLMMNYEQIAKAKLFITVGKGDHPETDASNLLDTKCI